MMILNPINLNFTMTNKNNKKKVKIICSNDIFDLILTIIGFNCNFDQTL